MKNVIEDAAYSIAVKKWQDLETSLMLVSEVLCNINFALTFSYSVTCDMAIASYLESFLRFVSFLCRWYYVTTLIAYLLW